MLSIQKYIRPQSLEEAYELNQVKNNRIVGGMLWLKTGSINIGTAIDLCDLSLNTIEESEEEFSIGAMVSLRQLEKHPGLSAYTQGAVTDAVKDIVGVQFRNMATVGGSLWGRFGFSDVLTVFLCMDTYVELYKGGIVALSDFIGMPKSRDILVRIIVKKRPVRIAYQAVRIQRTDFPVLTCAVAKDASGFRIAVGARPMAACLLTVDQNTEDIPAYAAEHIETGSNTRGSAEYRKHLINVLTARCLTRIGGL